MCSLATAKAHSRHAVGECTGSWPQGVTVCGGGTWSTRGARGPVRGNLWAGFLVESMTWSGDSASICSALSESYLPRSQPLPTLQVIQPTIQYSGWGKRKTSVFGSNHTVREARFSLTSSHFLPHEKSRAKKISLGPKLCHFGERVKSNCSFTLILFCSHGVLELFR